jgi:hypothetical protein
MPMKSGFCSDAAGARCSNGSPASQASLPACRSDPPRGLPAKYLSGGTLTELRGKLVGGSLVVQQKGANIPVPDHAGQFHHVEFLR